MVDSRRGEEHGDDRSLTKVAVRLDKAVIQLNISGEKKTFSGNRDLRDAMKLLEKKVGPKTAMMLYTVSEVMRLDDFE